MAPVSLPEAEEEVAQLELQLLEEEFSKPEVCVADENQAYGYMSHGACRMFICREHHAQCVLELALAGINGQSMICDVCESTEIPPTSFTIIKL